MHRRSSRATRAPRTPPAPRHIPGETGIWLLIFIDMTLFAIFFIVFMHYRSQNVALFDASSARLDTARGFANTLLLLTGSFGVVLGVRATRARETKLASRLLLAPVLCGVLFIANKLFEYRALINAGLGPSHDTFFTYYFALTIVHLVHLTLGTILAIGTRRTALREHFRVKDMLFVEIGASYWHMIDLLWIVLFALLYLVR